MTHFLANLAAYSAQIACVVGVGALVMAFLRVRPARIRYASWRLILVVCLALPLLQTPRSATASGDTVGFLRAREALPALPSSAIGPEPTSSVAKVPSLIVSILFGGMAVRLLWIGVGLVRLRRRTRTGEIVRGGDDQDLQQMLGTHADIRYLANLDHPVTFGVLVPIVLLPLELRSGPENIRRAVLCHELLHVRRRDWAWLVGEEIVRAAFWFHPAIWWLIAEIQITREEVVDGLVVSTTRDRRAYMEALVAFSDNSPLTPVTPFGRRRQLVRRIAMISKDVVMSRTRVCLSCATASLVVFVGSWYALGAFPLQAVGQTANGAGPMERQAKPTTSESPIPRRTHNVTPQCPPELLGHGFEVRLTVNLTLDASGRVAETHFIRGEFRGGPPRGSAASTSRGGAFTGTRALHDVPVQKLFQTAVDEAVRQWRYEAPAVAPMTFPVAFRFPPNRNAIEFKSELAPLGDRPWWHQDAVRAGNGVAAPKLIKSVKPVYPADAAAAGIQGTVLLEVLVDPRGRVRHARVKRSIPQLDQAAIDAARQWEFSPALDDPHAFVDPQAVIMTVSLQFSRP